MVWASQLLSVFAGVPATCREEVWAWLSDLYQDTHNPDWVFPEELQGERAFHELSQCTTEYEHSISVDIGVCVCVSACVYVL